MLRPLIPADLDRLMELAAEMHADSVYADYPLNVGQTSHILTALIESPDAFTMGAVFDGELIGAYIGEVVSDLWAEVRIGIDHAFYVAKAHRGGAAGVRLIRSFEQWASQQGADVIRPVVYAGIDNDGVSQIMLRLGYEQAGAVFKRSTASCA